MKYNRFCDTERIKKDCRAIKKLNECGAENYYVKNIIQSFFELINEFIN
jgi:hypothetical protein